VKKVNSTIEANVSTPIAVGDPLIVNVTVHENTEMHEIITGFVKLIINGETYIQELDHEMAQFKIYGLGSGTYINQTVEYMGDDFYNENSTNITFTVNPKGNYVMDVKVDNITYGQDATIRVLVPTDATGNVTIYVDNNIVRNVTIVNGTAILVVSGLAGGNHTVNATYGGDSNYAYKDKNNTIFAVNADTTWDMTIKGDYAPYGETSTITITTKPYNLTGNTLTIKIGNVSYVRNIVDGVVTLTLNNLSAGSYNATVTYDGDANYSNKTKKFFPNIPKATPTITLVQNGTDLIATVTGNVTGNLTFRVNNEPFTIDLTGNNATLVGKLHIGDNYVIATYNGNENYTTAEIADVYIVDKLNTQITVNPTNITFGENEIIEVTVDSRAAGFIAVNIDGKIQVAYIVEGVAKFNITGLAAKNYTDVTVTYFPTTTDFNGNQTKTSFRVDPTTNYKFNIKVDDIEYGQNATVRVSLVSSANGNVTIYVDGNFVGNATVTNGEAILANVTGPEGAKLTGGQHTVRVVYNGDTTYASKDNSTTFKVNPNTSWKVSVTEVD
jgi:hypothetical protein